MDSDMCTVFHLENSEIVSAYVFETKKVTNKHALHRITGLFRKNEWRLYEFLNKA